MLNGEWNCTRSDRLLMDMTWNGMLIATFYQISAKEFALWWVNSHNLSIIQPILPWLLGCK